MAEIAGQTISLIELTEAGTDELGNAIYTENTVNVDDVLIAPASAQEIVDTLTLYGKKVIYKLGIPKGDAHSWEAGNEVRFFGERFRIIAAPTQGIEAMIPLRWHKIVQVERIENEDRTEQ